MESTTPTIFEQVEQFIFIPVATREFISVIESSNCFSFKWPIISFVTLIVLLQLWQGFTRLATLTLLGVNRI